MLEPIVVNYEPKDGEAAMRDQLHGDGRQTLGTGGELLPEDVHRALDVLSPCLRAWRCPAGRALWTEGEHSGRLVVLDRGRVKILRHGPEGRMLLMYVLGPGEVFGFLPFVDGGPYPATAVALDDVEARVMGRTALRDALRDDPRIALVLLRALGRRLREAFARVEALAEHDAVGRVAAGLATLLPAEPRGDPLLLLQLPAPAYAFAAELGIEAETLSRALRKLVAAGVLHRVAAGRYQVLDPPSLLRRAAGRPPASDAKQSDRS